MISGGRDIEKKEALDKVKFEKGADVITRHSNKVG